MQESSLKTSNFIKNIIEEDLKNNKNEGRVITRFPPEPNGYLHIGHAKSICLNFGLAIQYKGRCHLRFDDTNPVKESQEFIDSIRKDVKWLGFDWQEHEYFASNYFDKLYDFAEQLIKKGKAYVCSLSPDEIREYRGTLTSPGKESPYRQRSIEENLQLFRDMRAGKYKEGEHILRAKIDMASPNLNMRDPALYRILHVPHHRSGDKWCIYPMYDFTHCLSDMLEDITHSICTLEFEDHRALYDWVLDELETPKHPQQIEFARLNINYTVMSKRKLHTLVEENIVDGWDDPRMPTISGLRRRGYTPFSIRDFCDRIGVAKANSIVDISLLEFCIREDLNKKAKRLMAVLDPLKVVIVNYPEDEHEYLEADNNPEDTNAGKRKIPFGRVVYIEKEDFREEPPKKYHRLSPGKEIRLLHAYYITCVDYKKDDKTGEILEVHCTYDPKTTGGWSEDGRKVKGTSHWVHEKMAKKIQVRLYDHLFTKENPEEEGSFLDCVNENSLQILNNCLAEEAIADINENEQIQFVRQGYFCIDSKYSNKDAPVFNRIVNLRDTWSKIAKKQQE